MGLGLALFVAGSALRTFGDLQADSAQAGAERQNAAYYREQERFMLDEMSRELSIFDRKSVKLKGEQKLALASRGSAVNSDDMMKLAYEATKMDSERLAIQKAGEFKARLAGLRAKQADDTASSLTSPERMFSRSMGLLTSFSSLDFAANGEDELTLGDPEPSSAKLWNMNPRTLNA